MKHEQEILKNPYCKKYNASFLNDIRAVRTYRIGSVLYHFVNRLNPLTWVFLAIAFVYTPIHCLFTDMTVQSHYRYLLRAIFKGELQ